MTDRSAQRLALAVGLITAVLLPALLTGPVALAGWAGAKVFLALMAGATATVHLAVSRCAVPGWPAATVVLACFASPPLTAYATPGLSRDAGGAVHRGGGERNDGDRDPFEAAHLTQALVLVLVLAGVAYAPPVSRGGATERSTSRWAERRPVGQQMIGEVDNL